MRNKTFSSIKEIIKDAKKGKMFILVDDKDRENEGDLIIPGSKCKQSSSKCSLGSYTDFFKDIFLKI